MEKLHSRFSSFILLALLSQTGKAAVTYTDATFGAAGNTAVFSAGSSTYVQFDPVAEANGSDGLWRLRAFGNGSTIFETGGDTAGGAANDENAARLRTVVSGLIAGQLYDVFAYYWDATSGNWDIQAGLVDLAGELPAFSDFLPGTQVTDAAAFEGTAPLFAEGDRALWQAWLGTAVADTSGTINVFVDDNPAVAGQQFRSWYDGVGVSVVPEPASALVLTGFCLGPILTRVNIRRRCGG